MYEALYCTPQAAVKYEFARHEGNRSRFYLPLVKGEWGDFGLATAGKSPLVPLCQRGGTEPIHHKLNGSVSVQNGLSFAGRIRYTSRDSPPKSPPATEKSCHGTS